MPLLLGAGGMRRKATRVQSEAFQVRVTTNCGTSVIGSLQQQHDYSIKQYAPHAPLITIAMVSSFRGWVRGGGDWALNPKAAATLRSEPRKVHGCFYGYHSAAFMDLPVLRHAGMENTM